MHPRGLVVFPVFSSRYTWLLATYSLASFSVHSLLPFAFDLFPGQIGNGTRASVSNSTDGPWDQHFA